MADFSCDIVVVGAGVLGLSVAAELTARGHDVRVVDAGRLNASAVAAGMIAPAFESLLDRVDAERAALLRDAADLWPAFAERFGLMLDVAPAEWRGPDAGEVAGFLTGLGFPVERSGEVVRVRGDLRIEPEAALDRLRAGLAHPVRIAGAKALRRSEARWRLETEAGAVEVEAVVLATGAASVLDGTPASVASLIDGIEPIAGQIGRSEAALTDRVLRGTGGYVAPNRNGAVIGATMSHGSRETTPDVEAGATLLDMAERLTGREISQPITWRAGVRGATPDGLPLAGPVGDGLHLALAPRRNGWLLGPLVGRVVADGIEGRSRGQHATALDPLRSIPAG